MASLQSRIEVDRATFKIVVIDENGTVVPKTTIAELVEVARVERRLRNAHARRKDYQAAAQEAFEEAGVSGRIHKHPMGAYNYAKADDAGDIKVMVYLLEVSEEHKDWPEREERRRKWVTAAEAARRLETALIPIVERLEVAPLDD